MLAGPTLSKSTCTIATGGSAPTIIAADDFDLVMPRMLGFDLVELGVLVRGLSDASIGAVLGPS